MKSFSKLKILIVILSCVLGTLFLIATPALLAGSGNDSQSSGSGQNNSSAGDTNVGGNKNQPSTSDPSLPYATYFDFTEDNLTLTVGETLTSTDVLYLSNQNAIVESLISNNCVILQFAPFRITGVNQGEADITLRVRMFDGSLISKTLTVLVSAADVQPTEKPFVLIAERTQDQGYSYKIAVNGESIKSPGIIGYEIITGDASVKLIGGCFIVESNGAWEIKFFLIQYPDVFVTATPDN